MGRQISRLCDGPLLHQRQAFSCTLHCRSAVLAICRSPRLRVSLRPREPKRCTRPANFLSRRAPPLRRCAPSAAFELQRRKFATSSLIHPLALFPRAIELLAASSNSILPLRLSPLRYEASFLTYRQRQVSSCATARQSNRFNRSVASQRYRARHVATRWGLFDEGSPRDHFFALSLICVPLSAPSIGQREP